MSYFLKILANVLALMFLVSRVGAMEITARLFDNRPLMEPTLQISMTGVIERGDLAKLELVLAGYDRIPLRELLFLLDSPGGDLFEGLALGTFINARNEITSAQVGYSEVPEAICASACLYVLLGSDYRYLVQNGRVGVHRFSSDLSDMGGQDALASAQEISGIIVSFISDMRADPALFDRMSSTPSEGIHWISREDLVNWRVITGPIYSETSEYKNISGKIALEMKQMSLYGENELLLTCGDGMLVGIATFQEPQAAVMGQFEIVLNGEGYVTNNWDILSRGNGRTRALFDVPSFMLPQVRNARTFGARIVVPSGDFFFGFEQTIRDSKLREMVEGCARQPEPLPPVSMISYPNIDFLGHDLTSGGFRDVSFQECQNICIQNLNCAAISYVVEKEWCWPKSAAAGAVATEGILSASRN